MTFPDPCSRCCSRCGLPVDWHDPDGRCGQARQRLDQLNKDWLAARGQKDDAASEGDGAGRGKVSGAARDLDDRRPQDIPETTEDTTADWPADDWWD